MSVAERYGIRGLIDSRHLMYRRPNYHPSRRRSLAEKRGKVCVHYAGPPQPLHLTDMALWQSYSRQHAATGRFGFGVTADGIQYHIGITRTGEKHLLTDIEYDRWHCGAWPQNGTHLAISLPIGGNQRATPAALQALTEVCDDWTTGYGRRNVIGHQEASPSDCPGTLMADFVYPYREGIMMTTEKGRWFPETECYVGGGMWEHWNNNGGLRVYGYPLTNEFDIEDENAPDGKRTIQVFERAVLEFHPEKEGENRILGRRLGAAVKDDLIAKSLS